MMENTNNTHYDTNINVTIDMKTKTIQYITIILIQNNIAPP